MFDYPIDVSTPALLFPAISLLMLAYTNRYIAVANLIRALHERRSREANRTLTRQIDSLRRRILLIRNMQTLGACSLLFSVLTMCLVFVGERGFATWSFAAALAAMVTSLFLSIREIQMSVRALDILLEDIDVASPRNP